MAITKMHYNNSYIRLIENDNFSIWGKIGEYKSSITAETYDVVTDVVIVKGSEAIKKNVIYKAFNIFFKYDTDFASLLENVLTYLSNREVTQYNLNISLNRVFLDHKTLGLKIAVRDIEKDKIEANRIAEQKKETEIENNIESDLNQLAYENNIVLCFNIGYTKCIILKADGHFNNNNLSKDFKISIFKEYDIDEIKRFKQFIDFIEIEDIYRNYHIVKLELFNLVESSIEKNKDQIA